MKTFKTIHSPESKIYFSCNIYFSKYKSAAFSVPARPFPVDSFSYSTRSDEEILQFHDIQENYDRSALSAIFLYVVQIDV